MLDMVAKLNTAVDTDADGNTKLVFRNLKVRAARLVYLVRSRNPDMYTVDYLLPGSVVLESMDFVTLQGALNCFDTAIRAGAVYALFKGIYNSPAGEGEVIVNLGFHDLLSM